MKSPKKMKYLWQALDLQKHEVIVVTGAGGKTSFCLELCEELKKENRVIFTTTTKILRPEMKSMYKILLGNDFLNAELKENGAYITGKEENNLGKITSFSLEKIESFVEKGDYLVIEGDGSKTKPLKGWNEREPVYVRNTDKTVGVLNIKSLGLIINSENVHRLELFLKITKANENEYVTKDHLLNIVKSKEGLFKGAKGERVLLINQADNDVEFKKALELSTIIGNSTGKLDKVIISSIKNKEYYRIF